MENPQESTSNPTVISSITSPVVQETVESVENITHLKQKIRTELQKESYPDLVFLFSPEALWVAWNLLKELLSQEKERFVKTSNKKNSDITFQDFLWDYVLSYYFWLLRFLKWIDSSEKIVSIIKEFEPLYIAFQDECMFDAKYYEKIQYALTHLDLDADQKRLLELQARSYQQNGIDKPLEIQKQISEINIQLTHLKNTFQSNSLESKKAFSYHITDAQILSWVPSSTLDAAQENAQNAWLDGYLFDADPNSYLDIMEYCDDRNIRKDFMNARNQFASSGDTDNREIILQILSLREQKAKLMDFQNHAELSLSRKMAQKPQIVFELIEWISQKARIKLEQEVQTLKDHFQIENIEAQDIAYYARKYKEEAFSLDQQKLKEYFKYEDVLEFMFKFVKNFYAVEFKQIHTPLYQDDMSLYEVHKDGKLISYYLLDPFYRKTKKSWAWADNPRGRNGEIVPFIINACNFQKNAKVTLLSIDDMETLFHEFGHALHEILSQSPYAELSWFQVAWDFVELPSQIHENWVTDPESLRRLARHHETGASLPEETTSTLATLKTFMAGLWTLRQNEFTLVDMYLHSLPTPQSVEELDTLALNLVNKFGYFPRGEEYKMYASFGHIFSSEYDAWYYSYMWAEILEADVFAKIKELWMFNPEVGKHFLNTILWQWSRKPESELFKDFMWRELDNTAFMRKKWLI